MEQGEEGEQAARHNWIKEEEDHEEDRKYFAKTRC